MNHTLELKIGDWSHDGHGRTKTVMIVSNLSKQEIIDAHKKGQSIVGISDICSGYDDNEIDSETLTKLISLGLPEDIFYDEVEEGLGINICTDEYVYIYLFLVGLGNSSFKYTLLEGNQINIGGYGLL